MHPASCAKIPPFPAWLGTGLTYGVPNALLLFVPIAVPSIRVTLGELPSITVLIATTAKGHQRWLPRWQLPGSEVG